MRCSALVWAAIVGAWIGGAARAQPVEELLPPPITTTNVTATNVAPLSSFATPLIASFRCAGPFEAWIYRGSQLRRVPATLRVPTPLSAELRMDGLAFQLARDPAANVFSGSATLANGIAGGLQPSTAAVHSLTLTIHSRRSLSGTLVDPQGKRALVVLKRQAMLPISPAELAERDAGPPADFAELFARNPDYGTHKKAFWYAFGPVFYRGRLDGSARVIVIASDPGPTECLPFVRRTLVGDAGQRVQGLLTKAGLTRSYVCVNAFTVALHPSQVALGKELLALPEQVAWRNEFYDKLVTPNLQAIVALGGPASEAVRQWKTRPAHVPVIYAVHPSSKDPALLAKTYRLAVERLRKVVTPDPDGDAKQPTYGDELTELDYVRIPRRDLPAEAPRWIGDDSWGRLEAAPHNNTAVRPKPDDQVSILFRNPDGTAFRYKAKKNTAPPGGAPQFEVTPYTFPVPLE